MERNEIQNGTVTDPVTKESFVQALGKLGIRKGQILEVHCSLSSFHWVIGGAETIVDGLMEALGENGTILMAEQTPDNTEPGQWHHPAVSPELVPAVRNAIPPYRTGITDIRGMGAVAENFRHRGGVIISNHPSVSYAAWGRYARLLCNRQSLHFPLAEESPAARLYELKGHVLLLGTDFDTCTCMHLAEYRTDARAIKLDGAAIRAGGTRVWKKYLDLDIDSQAFLKIRPVMEKKNMVRKAMFGGCPMMFFSANEAIDEASSWFERHTVYNLYR